MAVIDKRARSKRLGLCLLVVLGTGSCKGDEHAKGPAPAVPVRVARAAQRTVPIELHAIGTMEANRSVDLKAQVGGQLLRVTFREGDDVHRGQLLFLIDPHPFQVALAEARARLSGDLARLQNAELTLRRARGLAPDVVSTADLEKAQADRDAAAAAVQTDRAAVATARLNLGYCAIRAPMSGRAGSLVVNEGNLVKANADTPLMVLREISPIKVAFSVPEQNLDEVRERFRSGGLPLTVQPRGGSPPPQERGQGQEKEQGQPQRGELFFVDNTVNRTTGTVLLKGLLPNRQQELWPGEFVDVSLRLGERQRAIVIPAQAVQSGQQGHYVFRVKPDQTVEMRPVTVGAEVAGGTVIVERGISAGDLVVTDGQLRLRPGMRVHRQAEPRASLERRPAP